MLQHEGWTRNRVAHCQYFDFGRECYSVEMQTQVPTQTVSTLAFTLANTAAKGST